MTIASTKMLSKVLFAASALLPALTSAQVISDPGALGGPLEVVHLYYDQWPTGITVSRSGRKFSNYPGMPEKIMQEWQ
jgi:hypothetical protein